MLKVVGSGQAIISVGKGYNLQRLLTQKIRRQRSTKFPNPKEKTHRRFALILDLQEISTSKELMDEPPPQIN